MKLKGYGIELERLTQEDIELVRIHRNSKTINQYMEYRKNISEEQQLNWFNSINNIYNNYYIIKVNSNKIGLIYGANINWELKETGNGGVFIWDTNFWESSIPSCASILLTDTSILLGLKRTFIKVLSDNKKAIAFNKMLGYQLLESQNGLNKQYVLNINDYKLRREKILAYLFHNKPFPKSQLLLNSNNKIDAFYIKMINNQSKENTTFFDILIDNIS